MSPEENDQLRTTLKGGVVLFTPAVFEYPAWLRGRAIWQMTQAERFTRDDHSEGVFMFAGELWCWRIGVFADEISITLSLGHEG
jgi:hypothetical protein